MRAVLTIACFLACVTTAFAERFPERPGEREFILDEADLITPADEAVIREICDAARTETKVPILVVTIRSLNDYQAGHRSIERYAASLFNEWGVGFPDWNHGILLLISEGDRKARIELGYDYAGTRNREAKQVMDELIIPRFKEGKFSTGIVDGVRGLDAIARGIDIPRPPKPWWVWLAWVGFIALAAFTAASLIRKGSSGWAWVLWAAIFTVLFFILKAFLEGAARGGGSGSGSSGGGWSGGSFGGGFSGGGGATGSW